MDQLNVLLDAVKAYPMLSAAIAVLVTLIRLGYIKLPVSVPVLTPTAAPEGDGHDDLRTRVEKVAVAKFDELLDEGEDADDAYGAVIKALRSAAVPLPEPKETK